MAVDKLDLDFVYRISRVMNEALATLLASSKVS